MVSSAVDGPSGIRLLLQKWYVRVGFVIVGLIAVVVVLNIIPTIQDPTEGVAPVKVVNGLGRTIQLRMCDDDACRSTVDKRTLRKGASFDQNVSPTVPIPYRVAGADGTPLGCWVLPDRDHLQRDSAKITSVSPCPN